MTLLLFFVVRCGSQVSCGLIAVVSDHLRRSVDIETYIVARSGDINSAL